MSERMVYYYSEWDIGKSCQGPPSNIYVIDSQDQGPDGFQWITGETSKIDCLNISNWNLWVFFNCYI